MANSLVEINCWWGGRRTGSECFFIPCKQFRKSAFF